MKKTYPFLLALLALAYSCQKKIDQQSNTINSTNISTDVLSYFTSIGFNTRGITKTNDGYVLEGDMIIDNKSVQAAMNSKSTGQPKTNKISEQYAINGAPSADGTGIINWANTPNIPYYIDPGVNAMANGTDWVNAIVAATQNWTNIPNCSVSFVQVNTPAAARLIFYPANSANVPGGPIALAGSTYAASRFPQNGFIGNYMVINPNGPASSATGKISIMQHELGHTLGMRHSNSTVDGEGVNGPGLQNQQVNGDNLLNHTPTDDTQSIMYGTYDGTSALGFDTYDNSAAQQLYPDNITPGFSFGWLINNHTGRDVLYLYAATQGDIWYRIKIERMDNSGNIVSTAIYNGPDTYYVTAYAVATDYSGIHGNIDRNWRITVSNFKGDFSIVVSLTSPTLS